MTDWTRDAACRGATQTMTVSEKRSSPAREAKAKAICANCPVIDQCRQWAMQTPDPAVALVAGGLTPKERNALHNRPRAKTAECGTDSGWYKHRRLNEPTCQPCRLAHNAATSGRQRAATRDPIPAYTPANEYRPHTWTHQTEDEVA